VFPLGVSLNLHNWDPYLFFRIWLAALAVVAPATSAATQGRDIVIQVSVFRVEIERILRSDNLDTLTGRPREVADIMARIPKGRAPADFWQSYQRHVDAWQRFAEAIESGADQDELIAEERKLNSTFDDVERIARRYGARMPQPHIAARVP
jgi:hypothetical protein